MAHRNIAALLLLVTGCAPAPAPAPSGALAVAVAPLRLAGVTDATYTLAVTNADGEPVWTRAGLASTAYGDGAGSLSYVGPCDAEASPNTVTLTLEALATADGPLPASRWLNPTPVALSFACVADADVSVDFDLTVLRAAEQGFFDVSVNFDDLFCSAKLDCQSASGGPLLLLHEPTGQRGPTVVLGFACTAGPGQATTLYLDDLAVSCDGGTAYTVDPSGGPGNLGGAAPGLFQAATYRGREAFGSVDKCYWNAALGVGAAFGANCRLRATGTATSSAFAGLATPSGQRWPLITWDLALTGATGAVSCGRHAVNAGTEVTTVYTPAASPHTFAHGLVCADGSVLGGGPPVVLGFGPTAAEAGDVVTITGTGFGATEGTVTLGGAEADVQSWSPTAITVVVPEGGGTGAVVVTTDAGGSAPAASFIERSDLAPATVPQLNNGTSNHSIWDLDFDAVGNTYFAEFISGQDKIQVVHGDGATSSLYGNANWDMGFVAITPDGTTVVTTYSGGTDTPRWIGVTDVNHVVQPVYHSPVNACSSFAVYGPYAICGSCDPNWGYDGYFYVANGLVSGDVSRFVAASLVAGQPPVAVTASPLPAYVVSLATLPDGRLWAAAANKVYTVDKATGATAELASFGTAVRSIAASPFNGKLYVEADSALYELAPSGVATLRYSGLSGNGFLVVGPDRQVYRVEGRVDTLSVITSYAP